MRLGSYVRCTAVGIVLLPTGVGFGWWSNTTETCTRPQPAYILTKEDFQTTEAQRGEVIVSHNAVEMLKIKNRERKAQYQIINETYAGGYELLMDNVNDLFGRETLTLTPHGEGGGGVRGLPIHPDTSTLPLFDEEVIA